MIDRAEHLLAGGNVAGRVVRVGATVRKPSTAATAAVQALLEHLASVRFSGAPRGFGRDDQGRLVLEYIPGETADSQSPLSVDELRRLGALIRELHDAAAQFTPPADLEWTVAIPPDREELICHNDLAPWNLVRDGERWVFIDWDGAGPGSRLWDLGYAAHGFVPLHAGGDLRRDGPRLRALADGYGLDEQQRTAFPALTAAHTRGMFELLRRSARTGRQPWARLYAEGHAAHWGPPAEYIEAHLQAWTDALLSQ